MLPTHKIRLTGGFFLPKTCTVQKIWRILTIVKLLIVYAIPLEASDIDLSHHSVGLFLCPNPAHYIYGCLIQDMPGMEWVENQ